MTIFTFPREPTFSHGLQVPVSTGFGVGGIVTVRQYHGIDDQPAGRTMPSVKFWSIRKRIRKSFMKHPSAALETNHRKSPVKTFLSVKEGSKMFDLSLTKIEYSSYLSSIAPKLWISLSSRTVKNTYVVPCPDFLNQYGLIKMHL